MFAGNFSCLLLLLTFPAWPQSIDFNIRQLPPLQLLSDDSRDDISLDGKVAPAAILSTLKSPVSYNEFWLIGDVFPQSNIDSVNCYYLFTTSDSTGKFWASGYSPVQKSIRFLALETDSTGKVNIEILQEKQVYIRSPYLKYAFKTIFLPGAGKIKIEVNGVPMISDTPFDASALTMIGMAVTGGKARFAKPRLEGRP